MPLSSFSKEEGHAARPDTGHRGDAWLTRHFIGPGPPEPGLDYAPRFARVGMDVGCQ